MGEGGRSGLCRGEGTRQRWGVARMTGQVLNGTGVLEVQRGGGVQRRGAALSHSDPRFEAHKLPPKQAILEWVETGLGEGRGEGQAQAD